MSDRIGEILLDILEEVKAIREDVAYLKVNSDLENNSNEVIEALEALGDRVMGKFGSELGSDLGDIERAVAAVEGAVYSK